MTKTDYVGYGHRIYSLADLAFYMDDERREALHSDPFTTGDQTAQAWFDEYARRNPEDAKRCTALAPEITATECPADGSRVEFGACCDDCGVLAGDPCVACGETMYHRAECPLLDTPGFEAAPYVERRS